MEETGPAPDVLLPRVSETSEEISAEGPKYNDGIEEESNKETNEPQEGGSTSPVTEEEAAPEQISLKEVEEEAAPEQPWLKAVEEEAAPEQTSLKKVEEEAAPEQAWIKAVEEEVAPEQSSLKEIEEEAAPEQTWLKVVEEEVTPEQSSHKEVEKEAVPKQTSLKEVEEEAVEEEAAPEQTSLKEVEEEAAPEQTWLNEVEEEAAPEQTSLKEVEVEAAPEQTLLKALEEVAPEQTSLKAVDEEVAPEQTWLKAVEEEVASLQTSLEEVEEESLAKNQERDIPDRAVSEIRFLPKEPQKSRPEFSKSKKSLGQVFLRNGKSPANQPLDETVKKGQSVQSLISQGRNKGRDTACSSIQTSLIWEFKPLAEVLQSKFVSHHLSETSKKDSMSDESIPAGKAEPEQRVVREYYVNFQGLNKEEPPGDSQPAKEMESKLSTPESKAQKQPSEGQAPKDVNQQGMDNTVWIHPKTGKQMKCGFNQTNPAWERKPLADILRASSLRLDNASLGSGNGGAPVISQRIHVPYDPDDPEWAGYPNPFEY